MSIVVKFTGAYTPMRGTPDAAAFDLRASENVIIGPGMRAAVGTGIHVSIPRGYFGRILPRSGLALRNGIDIFAGVIDSDYRGEIKVIVYNSDASDVFRIASGDRIAQMAILPVPDAVFEHVDTLDDTARGIAGFGSTGV